MIGIGVNLWAAAMQTTGEALGPELWVPANATIQDAAGTSGAWNAGTGEFSNTVAGATGNAPRLRLVSSIEPGKIYRVVVTATGDTGSLFRAGGNNYVNASDGVIDGDFVATVDIFQIQGVGTSTFSMFLTVSLREVL